MAFKMILVFLAFFLLSCQANFLFEPVPKGLDSSNLMTAIKLRGIWVLGGKHQATTLVTQLLPMFWVKLTFTTLLRTLGTRT